MSRTIADLTAGTKVWIDETVDGSVIHTPYMYLGLDESGNARMLREVAVMAKRMHSSNVASYAGCEMDLYLENETDGFLARFDAETIDALIATSIAYVDYNQSADETPQVLTIPRRCFLLSYTEYGWAATAAGSEGQSYLAALKTYTGQTGDNAARIAYNANEQAVSAWMRSAISPSAFRYVGDSGAAYNYNATSAGLRFRPALSVAPATIVSDEGADAIFLLPEGRRTWWAVDAQTSLGVTPTRPKKAKLMLAQTADVYDLAVKACNNYGDTTPTWIDAVGGVYEFGDTKTAENWELGVKITAKGTTKDARIGEPAVIVVLEAEEGNGNA